LDFSWVHQIVDSCKKKKDRNFKQIKTDPEEKIEETKQLTGQWGD